MTTVKLLPYKAASKSAKAIAQELGIKRIKLQDSKYHAQDGDVVINWGYGRDPLPFTCDRVPGLNIHTYTMLNDAESIWGCSNKLEFFQKMAGNYWLPRFWTNQEDIPDEEFPIVCRTVLQGSSGDGIVIADSRDDLVSASLYVKYIKKKEEYRVHVNYLDGPFIVQQKKRRLDHEYPNWQIRNHDNGFIYARNDIAPPSRVLDVARDCFEQCDLEFGAVDVIWNESNQSAYVLEVNTAPGLEGSSVEDYVSFFKKVLDNLD